MVKLAKLFHVGGGAAPQMVLTLAPEKIKFCKDWLRGEENFKTSARLTTDAQVKTSSNYFIIYS